MTKLWFWSVLVWVDQGANTVLGPLLNWVLDPLHLFGDPDETLSSVLGKNVRDGACKGCYLTCRLLHLFDSNHCHKSIEDDEGTTNSIH